MKITLLPALRASLCDIVGIVRGDFLAFAADDYLLDVDPVGTNGLHVYCHPEQLTAQEIPPECPVPDRRKFKLMLSSESLAN